MFTTCSVDVSNLVPLLISAASLDFEFLVLSTFPQAVVVPEHCLSFYFDVFVFSVECVVLEFFFSLSFDLSGVTDPELCFFSVPLVDFVEFFFCFSLELPGVIDVAFCFFSVTLVCLEFFTLSLVVCLALILLKVSSSLLLFFLLTLVDL